MERSDLVAREVAPHYPWEELGAVTEPDPTPELRPLIRSEVVYDGEDANPLLLLKRSSLPRSCRSDLPFLPPSKAVAPLFSLQQPGSVPGSVPEKTMLSSSSSTMSSSDRDYKKIKFVLCGDKEFFEEVSESNVQPGDIVLVPCLNKTGIITNIFQHAAVYCGDGEVIHFQSTTSSENSRVISKEGFEAMKKERGECQILRKKGGINLNDFRCKVRKAMNSEDYHDLPINNCIEFALYLLDMAEFYMELVEIQNEDDSCSSRDMLTSVREYLLFGDKKIFEEVSESNLQPGDIVLFPFINISGVNNIIFQHAAVYCGDGEVIHFQRTAFFGKSGLISKEGFEAMKKERGKCRILRKKGGINLNDFRCKVRKAMNGEAYYDLCKNNCIHFALYLLDMAEFYMKLVEIQNEDDSGSSGAVSSSRQTVAGAMSTAAFFLCKEMLGQHFDEVPDGVAEPQPGDLFLFPLASGCPDWWEGHASVYCGDGEIIHLEGSSGTSPSGIVAKHGKSHLLRTRGPAKVLRKKGSLDAAALQQRIRAAMDQVVEYDAVTCNCVHFALALLGLGQLTTTMVSPALQ
ncbi:uncharacterized protein LOC129210755 isoform X2 [Grus americana]|uniref:uncharacterized protein LOC129210755 isoform X2 n=1 Tax=Grus americana TaxID=9117 RepID=UPI002408662F|nr:uncharacterized protein LOC129210755 isoform X2 [Grus americana]